MTCIECKKRETVDYVCAKCQKKQWKKWDKMVADQKPERTRVTLLDYIQTYM